MSRIVATLVIRADASTQIGTGHLMRCLALAQAWKDTGGQVVFITACQSESLLQRLKEEGFDIHLLARPYPHAGDREYTKDILAAYPGDWVILDGYHFDEVYQQQVKESGHRLLVIDDMAHLKHYYADIILNQNLHADQLRYSCEPHTRLLLGTRYVLLRREFLAWRNWRRETPEVARRVLVTLGGSDLENHTLRVIQALDKVEVAGLEATVIVGACNPHRDVLEAVTKRSRIPIRLIRNTQNIADLIAWADVAVSAAGTTTWELLFLGTPILALIAAGNQQHLAEQIQIHKVGRNLGAIDDTSIETVVETVTLFVGDFDSRAEACENGRRIVDGQGAQRVMSLVQKNGSLLLKLRPAIPDDCRMVWGWANEATVRAASFNSHLIRWDEHVEWFETRLSDPKCSYYIVLNDLGLPIGQVRFDAARNEAEINISIDSSLHGHGLGTKAIRMASERLFRETQVTRINANIKPENTASVHAFAKAGYRETGRRLAKGQQALQMSLEKYNSTERKE